MQPKARTRDPAPAQTRPASEQASGTATFADHRAEAQAQQHRQAHADASPQAVAQRQRQANVNSDSATAQRKPSKKARRRAAKKRNAKKKKQQHIDRGIAYREKKGLDVEEPAPRTLVRSDDYFPQHSYTKNNKVNKSSYVKFDNRGIPSLVPAKADGSTNVLNHVIGGSAEKNTSPYTSFSAQQHPASSPHGAQEKSYGNFEMEVNLDKLEQDPNIDVTSNRQIKRTIERNTLDKVGIKPSRQPINEEEIAPLVAESGLNQKNKDSYERRLYALSHTQRDKEHLVKGTIPSEYIRRIGPAKSIWNPLKEELSSAQEAHQERVSQGALRMTRPRED